VSGSDTFDMSMGNLSLVSRACQHRRGRLAIGHESSDYQEMRPRQHDAANRSDSSKL